MQRFYYSATIASFLVQSNHEILGALTEANEFELRQEQRDAWLAQITILRESLPRLAGVIVFEFAVPRMGKRIDTVLVIGPSVFLLEFKIGAVYFDRAAIDQVHDYALDLHYFHEPSHDVLLQPILVATEAQPPKIPGEFGLVTGAVRNPVCLVPDQLGGFLSSYEASDSAPPVDSDVWLTGRYSPTPTIVEAARALYRGHEVEDISRNDAGGTSLRHTSDAVSQVIVRSRDVCEKSICFVTGVPGAGKTLIGLNIANKHTDPKGELYSVFLSGNGPLVSVLREALSRDAVDAAYARGERLKKSQARTQVQQFIQNVHHFRDECLRDQRPPIEHVALFDEAQRAWNLHQTASFMARKKKKANFSYSEPAFLISCLDRHPEWATVVCLVGGGQEINTGEGGIREWIDALRDFPEWRVYISPELRGEEFDAGGGLQELLREQRVQMDRRFHLRVSMRSFRAENVSNLVGALLELDVDSARKHLRDCADRYPVVLTRNLHEAKAWIRQRARGSERYGLVVSSAAERLRPHAINVKAPVDPVHWFLDGKEDVRSSYYMEDVATEFHIQGLELDWACVTWDADFRFSKSGWQNYDFVGSRWNRIQKADRRRFQKNAYRVLLTRARQGMVIVVPEGDSADPTRLPEFYDPTYEYLRSAGIPDLN